MHALGRVGARVQGADRHVLGRVRPRRRRRLGLDQVRAERVARDRLRVPAQREVRRQELLRAADGAQGARSTATSTAPRCPGPIIKNKTFFFVDFAGLKEERGQVFVNTVPTEATRRGDFSDYRDRNGNLIPIYDPLTTRAQPERRGLRAQPLPRQRDPRRTASTRSGMNVASIYPTPERPGHLRQLHLDRQPLGARQRLHRPPRPPRGRAATASSCATATTSTSSTPRRARRRAACRRRPTPRSRFDLGPFVAGIQNTRLTTQGGAFNWTHLFGPTRRQRAARRLREDEPRDAPVGLRARSRRRASGIQGINVTEFTTRPAEPQHPGPDRHLGRARRSCRSTRSRPTTRSRTRSRG